MASIQLNGNIHGRPSDHTSLGAITIGTPNEHGYYRRTFGQPITVFDMHQSEKVCIQRQLIHYSSDYEGPLGTFDELVVWLKTNAVSIQDGTTLVLEADGQKFEITPSSPQQRLVLQFEDHEVPDGIGEGFTRSLRLDGHATREEEVEKTAIKNLYLDGTAQFRARVRKHLALFDDFPGIRNLLDKAQKRHDQVPVILIQQLYEGTPRFGPGYAFRYPPEGFEGVFASHYPKVTTLQTHVLYDPYAAEGLDALVVLLKVLQRTYESLAVASTPEAPQGE